MKVCNQKIEPNLLKLQEDYENGKLEEEAAAEEAEDGDGGEQEDA